MRRWQSVMAFVLVMAFGLGAGCKKPRKVVLSKEQQQQIQGAILTSAPAPERPLGVELDGMVRLVGVDLSTAKLDAGGELEVSWYWEALADLSGDWKIFVHLEAPRKKRTVHDHQAVGELLPVAKWKKGQIIRDSQTIQVAKDFPTGPTKLYVGIFDERAWAERRVDIRMKVTNEGKHQARVDSEGRVEAATIQIDKGAKAPATGDRAAVPRDRKYTAYRVAAAPAVDGELDEPAWRKARPTQPFVQPDGKVLTPKHLTQARLLWDDTHLYVGASCRDDDIWNTLEGRDSTLWEQDVIEVYLDPGADGKDYVEIQVSPTGEIFDAHFSTHRKPEWPEAAKKLTLSGMVVKLELDGSVNARGDGVTDRRWSVEAAIPFAELPGVDGPPADGTEWAANFYRIDGKTPSRGGFMGAWAPAGGDFHNTKRFGKLAFKASAPPKVARPFGKAGGASGTPAALPKVDLEKARAAAAAAAAAKAAGARSEPAPAAKATDGPSEGPSAGPE